MTSPFTSLVLISLEFEDDLNSADGADKFPKKDNLEDAPLAREGVEELSVEYLPAVRIGLPHPRGR